MGPMEYRRLGKSGLKVSALSYGSWVTFGSQVDESLARDLLTLAYERGVNFFDNAEAYSGGESERIMGNALKKIGWGRDTYVVSSKVFWGGGRPTQMGLSRKHVTDACHAALKRLQVDYLDLYFCHRPDLHTPIEETVWAMNDLIRQGKVLYWGTSEWSAQAITEAWVVARENHLVGPTMEQPEYNMFHREKVEAEFLPLYEKHGLGTTIWSPLASGLLSGKYAQGIPKDSRANVAGYDWHRSRSL
jgi:voltage-dependent potassium channel beta subunit